MEKRKTVQLSARLQTLADMVTPGNRAADIGCDHGFVSIYLVQQGICPHVIAADVRTGPLSRAGEHVAEYGLGEYIETRLSDGLAGLEAGEADTLICAGMGGRLMKRILQQDEAKAGSFRELILQPQSELEEFRVFLRRARYRIVRETALCEDGKYYFAMKAVPCRDTEEAAQQAPQTDSAPQGEQETDGAPQENQETNHVPQRLADKYGALLLEQRHPVLRDYLEYQRSVYRSAAAQIEALETENPRTAGRLAQLREELHDLEAALQFYNGNRCFAIT